ncbi:MAG: DUF378 domain-containing protein [Chlamydiales bacterium]
MRFIHWVALILVIVGALNWGIWGIFQIDMVANIFDGASSSMSRIIYTLVGLAGLWCCSFFKMLACCQISCKKGK